MQKSAISTIFGLMLIVIIIETTSLTSTLPPAKEFAGNPVQIPPSQIVPTAPLPQQEQLQSDPTKDSVDSASFLPGAEGAAARTLGDPSQGTDTTNATAGFWGDSMALNSDGTIQNGNTPQLDPVGSTDTGPGFKYVQYDTPLPDGNDNLSDFQHAVVKPLPTLPPEEMVEIFRDNQLYQYNRSAISYHLVNPPMTITFNVTPRMEEDSKWIPNRDIIKTGEDGKIVNVTRPDLNSWFCITVIDKDNAGSVVQKDGYGREYNLDPSKSIVIRNAGNYQIQFEGGYINAETSITVPRKENIV